jgi:hypothetical protein
MSGLVDRFRALPVPIVSTIWYNLVDVYVSSHAGYEKMSGRARMSAQITKNSKKRVAVKT